MNSKNFVIASPTIAWMINFNPADFQILIVYDGYPSIHLPANIPSDQFSYNSDYRLAKFVIVDKIWGDNAIHDNYYISKMNEEINKSPVVWSSELERIDLNENRK